MLNTNWVDMHSLNFIFISVLTVEHHFIYRYTKNALFNDLQMHWRQMTRKQI